MNDTFNWRKSSYSAGQGNCLEVTGVLAATAAWRKSSHSGQGNTCVEMARHQVRTVAVRDSKNPGHGHVPFRSEAWRTLIDGIKAGN